MAEVAYGGGAELQFWLPPIYGLQPAVSMYKVLEAGTGGAVTQPSTTGLDQGDPQDPPSHVTTNKHPPSRISHMVMCLS